MRKLAVAFGVWIFFFALTTFAHADPIKDKNAGQEIAEKFISLIFESNFQEAVKLVKDEKDSDALKQGAEALKADFDKAGVTWQENYSRDFNGAMLNSRTLALQTLVSSRRGDDGKKFNILVYFTEDHAVSMPGKAKPWRFYWHYEVMFEVTGGKITNVKYDIAPEILMILKPENCVRPVVC